MKQLFFLIFLALTSCNQKPDTPNIVIIFTDDQGYGDVGCYGAEGFKTPNLDAMAKDGIRFTDFYVSQAVCSASRASLMTGSYSERVGVQGALLPWDLKGLDPKTETIAKLLKRHGYTNAVFGKWHLGHSEKYLPLQNGFDDYAGLICSNDMWPVGYDGEPLTGKKRSYYPTMSFWEGNDAKDPVQNFYDQGQLTTRITEKAVNFIHQNKDRPFFLYMPHPMPHQPIAVSEKFAGKSELGLYGDVMMEIDWSVGKILNALQENGIDDNTFVIFASDNGPALNFGKWGGSAGPLREGKGTMWEGGARVPCIMKWPERIQKNQVISNMAGTIDILPTIAEIVGDKTERKIDGISILPLLEGVQGANPRNELFYYYGEKLIAVRQGKWKLVFPHEHRSYINVEPGENLFPGKYGKGTAGLELYNLEKDIGETTDVSSEFQDVVAELQKLGDHARQALGDKLTNTIGSEAYTTICGIKPPSSVELDHQAVHKKLTLVNHAHKKYPGERLDALVNGKGGTTNFRNESWQGFEAEDVVATIDLGSVQTVNSIEARFLQDQVVWIFLPKKVEILHSVDSEKFESLFETFPNNEFSFVQDIFSYKVSDQNLETRFIKVIGNNLNQCPDYHPGAGRPCWIFTDEIVVN